MRLIDADELIEHVWRDRLDSRERIADLVKSMPSAEPQYTEQDMRDQFNAGYACGMEAAQPDDEETNYWHEKANSYEQTLAKLTQNIAEQPEIIRCNSCKHWTQSTGKMKGYGLGRCDFHDADLVTCNGFCYWAERRNDE